jgi:hypothetical protein
VRLLGDLADRAAEVDVDHADLKSLHQPAADGCQHLRIVVPDLHGQRPRFALSAPQSPGNGVTMGVDLQQSACADHLGAEQARPTEAADDLPVGVVGKTGHRRLQYRRIDQQRPDLQRLCGEAHGRVQRTCSFRPDTVDAQPPLFWDHGRSPSGGQAWRRRLHRLHYALNDLA